MDSKNFDEILKILASENEWDYSTFSQIDEKAREFFPFKKARKNQLETISEIKEAIDKGYKYIVLEAGTGTGKSAIAATLASIYGSTYILTVTKQLQNQYLSDFKDFGFKLVKGRSNFKCKKYAEDNIHQNCDEGRCILEGYKCEYSIKNNYSNISKKSICEYDYQKFLGLISEVVISNYPYLFLELNYVQDFHKRKLMIFDEAHRLEDTIMNQLKLEFDRKELKEYIGVNLSKQTIDDLNNGSYEVWIKFIKKIRDRYLEEYEKVKNLKKSEVNEKRNYLKIRIDDCNRFISHIKKDPEIWIFDYDSYWGVAEFKPIKVDKYAKDTFFRYGEVCIFMSATILDYKLFAKWLGLNVDEVYAIRQKSPFEINRNPIVTFDDYNMSYNTLNETAPKTIGVIERILERHRDEKGIIHTVSYSCKNFLKKNIATDRFIDHKTYNRTKQLNKFKNSDKPLVLISPSMNEGVDLPGDLCRFQIIYKIPYPNLSDKQTNLRMRIDNKWYKYKTALSLVQTVGRGMRYEDDYCMTYFIDNRLFDFIVQDTFNNFLPDSFKDAINIKPAKIDKTKVSEYKKSDIVRTRIEEPSLHTSVEPKCDNRSYEEMVAQKYELTVEGNNLLDDEKYDEAIEFYSDLLGNELFINDYHPYLKLSKAYRAVGRYDEEIDIITKFFHSGIYCRKSTLNWFKKRLKKLDEWGYYDYSEIGELERIYKSSGAKNQKLSKVPVPLACDVKGGMKNINRNPKRYSPHIFDDVVKIDDNLSYEEKINFKYHLIQFGDKLINDKKYVKAIAFYTRLLTHELFANDYHPYRKLSRAYRKDRQRKEECEIITQFFKSGIYCNDKQLKWFKNRLKQLSNYGHFDYSKVKDLEKEFNNYGALNEELSDVPVPLAIDIKNALKKKKSDDSFDNMDANENPEIKIKMPLNKYSVNYFNTLAKEIEDDPDFVSDNDILYNEEKDFVYIGNGDDQLNQKAQLKNKGKRLEKEDELEAVKFYNQLKQNDLFKQDYWPYRRQCILFKNKIKDSSEDWRTIKEIFSNEIPLNAYQYIWLNNKVLELIGILNLDDLEIDEMESLLQNYETNHERFIRPSIPIAERIYNEDDGKLKVLSVEKYDYLQDIFYVKELGVGYIRRGEYETAISYFVNLLNQDFLHFKHHAYKQLARIYREMDDSEEFNRIYENIINGDTI